MAPRRPRQAPALAGPPPTLFAMTCNTRNDLDFRINVRGWMAARGTLALDQFGMEARHQPTRPLRRAKARFDYFVAVSGGTLICATCRARWSYAARVCQACDPKAQRRRAREQRAREAGR